MSDWSAYDTIASRYDEVWGPRFEAVARLVWERVRPAANAVVLDIGTGTGIVPRGLGSKASALRLVVGCDRSPGMIRLASARMPSLRAAAADALALPFRASRFDVATASFLLSHLANVEGGLAEIRRVLRPGGQLAVTSWAAGQDAPSEAWSSLLAGAVASERIDAASARVAPSETRFECADGVARALTDAGFVRIGVASHTIEGRVSTDRFLADRELASGARFARDVLGEVEWARLLARARGELERRFGRELTFARGVLIATAERPS
jgi:ubiquinone/menaquinone biosynthesis C-methylase UbiE